ncbi:MAG: DedA family protein [Puniceicoccales bacterium]|jgi:membrane-associated protein|nr:DedA family protein [Puniceicoccales bacterium]
MISLARQLLDFILHIDTHLSHLIAQYGAWTYALLFAIIFAETGFVITPFLPGDSLLFAAGALSAKSGTQLNIHLLSALLWAAAVLGDSLNYWLGSKIGPKVFTRDDSFFLRKKHLERARDFFEKYGGRAIILARFVPIVRTFVPFVAGIGKMNYARFIAYNIAGGFLWIYAFTYTGYCFGGLEIVKRNFHTVIIAIILISVIPIVWEFWRNYSRRPKTTPTEN